MRVLDRSDELTEVGLHLGEGAGGSVQQLVTHVFVGLGAAERLDRELRPEAGMNGIAAGHEHDLPRDAVLTHLGDTVPDNRWDAAGAVAERELQVFAAISARPQLDFTHEQRLRDLDSVRKFPNLHDAAKIEWRADGSMPSSAIVTGGTGGLGAAVVKRLHTAGWRVVVPWIMEAELARIEEAEGVELVQADLFDPTAVAEVVRVVTAAPEAPLRGLVNLVGGFAMGARVHETPVETFEQQFRLNLRPTYLMTQAAVVPMLDQGGGSIVCVGTRAAVQPFKGAAGYIASKAAVIAFSQAVATEYRDDGIRCNAVLPSVIDTPGNRASMPKADHDRWVKPEEIADVISFLLSSASGPTSGAAIPVYGRA